jgi:hypothetical protein
MYSVTGYKMHKEKIMKSRYYPVNFAVPDYAAARLYDCVIAKNREASPESLNHALERLFIQEPEVLAEYFLPTTNHVYATTPA